MVANSARGQLSSLETVGWEAGNTFVQMTLSRVIDKMVVDEGRALQPCRFRLFTHMSCIILFPYSTQPCRGYTHVITNTGGNNY